eukprot:TRINITY_DN3283_c0_g1_i1.p1 TRINITY_DN3283_c0_g1~~TRINITY_DN3283_c0_g1_i1.p1  ORF type:complete len:234 (+),score=10.84 TRINITY_DN3283_c0_g1_i1:87-788(+)
MADELADFEDELNTLLEEIDKGIKALPKIKAEADRELKITHINNRISRAKDSLRSYKVEIRELSSKAEAVPYQAKAKEFGDAINQYIQDLTFAQDKAQNAPPGKGPAKPPPKKLDDMTADEVLNKAAETQVKSITSLDNTLRMIEETKAIGAETAAELKAQTEKLGGVDKDLDEMESYLKQADKQMRAFVRRMATDKIILAFIFLIVAGIIFIIVWSVLHPDDKIGLVDSIAN